MPSDTRRHLARSALALGMTTLLLAACSAGRPAVVGPVAGAEGAAMALEQETRLEEPLQVFFEWRLNEARQRHRGTGVARVEPPYSARLDLFTDDLETVATAVLLDGQLLLPPRSQEDILPPTDLMWGTLGVVRPHGVRLLGGDRLEDDATRLRYAYEDGRELHYEMIDGHMRSAELLEDGHVVQRVELEFGAGDRYPRQATYRHLGEFRELTIVRRSLESSEPFDPEIWDPS